MKTIQVKGERTFAPPLRFPGKWEVALQEMTLRLSPLPNEGSIAYETFANNVWKTRSFFKIPMYSTLDQLLALCAKHVPWEGAYAIRQSASNGVDILMPDNGTSRLTLNARMQRVFPTAVDGVIHNTTKGLVTHMKELEPSLDIYIHADFIPKVDTAGRNQPLLRLIPYLSEHVTHFTPRHLEWHPLAFEEITNFQLNLFNSRMQPIKSDYATFILAFKQTSPV